MNYKVEATWFIFLIFFIMKSGNLRAFTFVELLISLSILSLLAVIWYTAVGNKQENTLNTKVTSEVESLKNALLLAKQETSQLPMPDGNNNFYAIDTSYTHDYEDEETYGVHGFVTQNTLPKKYIDVLPVDPRTNSYYAYGKTKWSEMYEIASVIFENDEPKSKVIWDYTAQEGPFNLIREYNGPYFVDDNSLQNFAYNPYEKILTAKIWENSWNISINGVVVSQEEIQNTTLVSGDVILVPQNGNATLYFSDGTVSNLWDTSQDTQLILQNLEFPSQTNLITKVQLVLQSGMIWNKAASLDDESEFEIYTIDSTAAVRGTIFWVQKNPNNSQIVVSQWEVWVYKNYEANLETLAEKISQNQPISREPVRGNNITIDSQTQESYIQVESGQPSKWVEIDSQNQQQETPSSLDALDDTTQETKKEVEENISKFSKNIWFEVKNFTVSSEWKIESLILKMHKRVWKSTDFIEISGDLETTIQKIESLKWEEKNYVLIDISSQIPSSFIAQSENINKQKNISIFSKAYWSYDREPSRPKGDSITSWAYPAWDITSSWDGTYSLSETSSEGDASGITTQGNKIITIRLVQSRNSQKYYSKPVTLPVIKQTEISQETENQTLPPLVRKDPKDVLPDDEEEPVWECENPFWEDNNYCWEKSPGIDEDFSLAYYAPYDLVGNINIYNSSFKDELWWSNSITRNNTPLPDDCITWSDKSNSFCVLSDGTKGIFIDNKGWNWTYKDYIKYEWLDINQDFIFEINVRWEALNRSTWTYFLFSNEKVKLYLQNRELILEIDDSEKWSINISYFSLIDNSKNYSVLLIKDNGKIGIQLWDTSRSWESDYEIKEYDYNYIWVNKNWTTSQWNDIINYIKIYDK